MSALASLDTETLAIAGRSASAGLADVLVSMTLDASAGSVAQLSITAKDEGSVLSSLATTGAAVTWQGQAWMVGAVTRSRGSDNVVLVTMECRSTLAKKLRRIYRASAEAKVSPSEWVARRVKSAGGLAACQPSSRQSTIAQMGGNDRQSVLDVIASLAGDLGWDWCETGGRLIFGSRYWAWTGVPAGQKSWPVTWATSPASDALSIEVTSDDDDTDNARSGTIVVPYASGVRMQPWDRVRLAGSGVDDGMYLIDSLSVTADLVTPVSIQVSRPRQPAKKAGST